jgi:hypothetical protein
MYHRAWPRAAVFSTQPSVLFLKYDLAYTNSGITFPTLPSRREIHPIGKRRDPWSFGNKAPKTIDFFVYLILSQRERVAIYIE